MGTLFAADAAEDSEVVLSFRVAVKLGLTSTGVDGRGAAVFEETGMTGTGDAARTLKGLEVLPSSGRPEGQKGGKKSGDHNT